MGDYPAAARRRALLGARDLRVAECAVNRPPPSRSHPSGTKLRKWAGEARTIARTFRDSKARARMLIIAAEYDRMAERAERPQRDLESRPQRRTDV